MANIIIKPVKQDIIIAGETVGGNFSTGKCSTYAVQSENNSWNVELAKTIWENGEEEISAKSGNPEILHLIRNRLRMVISKTDCSKYPNTKYVTLRTAVLSTEGSTLWANLHNTSIGELSDFVNGNISNYFKKLGAHTVDYKIDIFKTKGTTANQLVVIFPKDNVEIIIHAFILTRVYPLVQSVSGHEHTTA